VGIEVKKRERENPRSLLRRFSRRIQQSGILIRARKARFREREKTKRAVSYTHLTLPTSDLV